MAPPRRIAVVALSDAEENDKIALLLYGIRAAGHVPILVDAAPFAAGAARVVPGGIAGMRVAGRAEIRGRHREAGGAIRTVTVGEVPVVTADPDATEVIPVDAVWPEALDITRRLAFEGLYRQIEEHRVPTLAGSWESVLNATFKHRTRRLLAHLPQPRWEVVTAGMSDGGIERVREWLGDGDLWVKAPGDTHGRGITLVPRGEPLAPVARRAMRDTPDGPLCLIEEDACGRYGPDRADLAVTVLDGRVLHVALRVQADPRLPTSGAHGGRAIAVDPAALPAPTRALAVEALAATGNRYGSVDIFGGEHAVAGEVNVMPGGHGPGFRDAVVGAVVAAYTRELRLSPVVQGAVG